MDCSELFIKWAYGRGRYIYRQHDTPEELFLIESGIVSVEIDCSIVKELGDREYFGHDTVCFDSPRSESIRVVSPEVVVFAIRKDKIMPIIQERMSDYK